MIKILIPSKDRAAQLDLFLRSMKRFFEEWGDQTISILYRTTTPETKEAYGIVMRDHPGFIYIEEDNCRKDIQKIALSGTEGYLQLFMDDDVFIRPFTLTCPEFKRFQNNDQVIALALRLDHNISYCYTENVETGTPWFKNDRTYYWPGLRGDWGYPNSVDGMIWRRCDIRAAVANGKYTRLHELEPALRNGMTRPLVMCLPQRCITNVADNSVQDTNIPNRHGGGDALAMNRRFLDGERISMENIILAEPVSPHFEIDYEWQAA